MHAAFHLALIFCATTWASPLSRQLETLRPGPSSNFQRFDFLGRVNPKTRELTWPSTGISYSFEGSTAQIHIANASGDNSADLIIDNGNPTVITNITDGALSIPKLPFGRHSIVLRKRSEDLYGTFIVDSVSSSGVPVPSSRPRRRIEIIGDSISVGYGLDGVFPCVNTAALEDNPLTYGALAAKKFGADYSTIAWSGKGLIRNTVSSPDGPLMPELYTRYGAEDPDNSYPFPKATAPDAIVIALGTNDFSYLGVRDPVNAPAFTEAMVTFVRSIERHYPDAQYFLLSSPMLNDDYPTTADAQHTTLSNALKSAAASIGPRAHFVDWPAQGAAVGCDYHPNAATHAEGARLLEAALASVLKW